MRVGILDILAIPSQNVGKSFYHLMVSKQLASITPQAISVWCRQLGHETFYATYHGLGHLDHLLPDDLDIVFIACYTKASALAYVLAKMYRQKGVTTVIGGAHAKAFPQDCLRFFDLVVKECDKDLIANILKGQFRPGSYISSLKPFSILPTVEERMPEILASAFFKGKYRFPLTTIPMLMSTGCPYDCDFCTEWNKPYNQFSSEQLKIDLQYLAKNHPNTLMAFQDPNFGIKFDEILDVLEDTPLNLRNPYMIQNSLTVLKKQERMERLKRTNCILIAPSIETWSDPLSKTATGRKNGPEKLKQIVAHIQQLYTYVPYAQINFIFGLDTDEGNEPIELTKSFVDQTPFYWQSINIPVPFGGTPLFTKQYTQGRILENIPFTFYFDPYLVMSLKNYNPITYYQKLSDLSAHITSQTTLKNRLKSTSQPQLKFMHWLRTKSTRQNLEKYRQMVQLLETDRNFLAFHETDSKKLPDFYQQEHERILAPYGKYLSVAERQPDLGQLEPFIAVAG